MNKQKHKDYLDLQKRYNNIRTVLVILERVVILSTVEELKEAGTDLEDVRLAITKVDSHLEDIAIKLLEYHFK